MGPHNKYNTNLYPADEESVFDLFNEYDLKIATCNCREGKVTWHHSSIMEHDAAIIVAEHQEMIASNSHWKQTRNYHTFHFRSTFHAISETMIDSSNMYSVIEVPHIVAKQLSNFNKHLKTCALNPSTFSSVGTCCFCQLGCDIWDMTLVSVGVPIVDDQRANIHGVNKVAINPVCSTCAEGVHIQ